MEDLGHDTAVTIVSPLERRALLGGLSLRLFFRLNGERGFPGATQGGGGIVFLRSHLAVLDSKRLNLGDEFGVLAIEVVKDHVGADQRG